MHGVIQSAALISVQLFLSIGFHFICGF